MNKAATIYSIITAIGAIAAIIAGAIWIIAAIRHRPATVAKIICIGGVLAFAVGLVLFVRAYDPALAHSKEEITATPQSTEAKTEAPASTPTEAPVEPAESQAQTEDTTAFTVETKPVMNGTKTEQIGTWAYILTTKEIMGHMTNQQLHDLLAAQDAAGYNWFNVFFEDGTGIYYLVGVDGTYFEYGAVDPAEGGVVDTADIDGAGVFLFEGGAYSMLN